MKSMVARAFDPEDELAEIPNHKFYLEVLLPPAEIMKAGNEDIVGARTDSDIIWTGPAAKGDSMVLCHEGIDLEIAKVIHWPFVLNNFENDEFTSLIFHGTREHIDTLLKNTGLEPAVWVPIIGYERK